MSGSSLLQLYHSLPHPMRELAASLRGRNLSRWRYGEETDRLVGEAIERETWIRTDWELWRARRMAEILEHAATAVPHYRDYWAERQRWGEPSNWLDLAQWPVLKKECVRKEAEAFVASNRRHERLFSEHTSGTTGTPLRLWWGRETVRAWYALFEARVRRWNGVDRRDRWGMLGGQLVVPADQSRPPYWVWNRAMNQLYLSSYHLSPASVGSYLDALERHGVSYLLGYASSLDSLSQLAQDAGLTAPPMTVAISNAEPLLEHQRSRIAEVFRCPVRNTYGMAEGVAAGSECSQGVMHEWPEVGIVEILRDDADAPVDPGTPGRIVATGLLNPAMPLIRYDTGDRGRFLQGSGPSCACGRTLPVLAEIDGRCDDVLITADGRRIGRLDPVFRAGPARGPDRAGEPELHSSARRSCRRIRRKCLRHDRRVAAGPPRPGRGDRLREGRSHSAHERREVPLRDLEYLLEPDPVTMSTGVNGNRDLPLVSVVMPVRNEADFIEQSLRAVLAQDYPPDRIQIFVADGMSSDGTREKVMALAERDRRVRLVEIPPGSWPPV